MPIENEEKKIIEDGFDETKAKKRVINSLKSACDARKLVIDGSINMSVEELWTESDAARLSVSTKKNNSNSNSDYYNPVLFGSIKRLTDRAKTANFRAEDYFAIEGMEADEKPDEIEAKATKDLLDVKLKESNFIKWAKMVIEDSGWLSNGIGKMAPVKDIHPVTYRNKQGEVVTEDLTKKHIELTNVDIHDLYYENPYEEDLQKNNITELIETTVDELKALQKQGYYENVDEVKPGILPDKYNVVDNFNQEKRQLLSQTDKQKNRILIAEYWGNFRIDGEMKEVNIVLAGEVVIRAKVNPYWHGKKPYIDFSWERRKGEAFGISLAKRFLKAQWAINQVANMDIEGSLINISGAMIAKANTGNFIEKQLKNGRISPRQIIKVPISNQVPISNEIFPLQFPDVHRTAQELSGTIENSLNLNMGSSPILAGSPTGTQLDRTASGYQSAISEAYAGLEDVVTNIQDDFIGPAITMFYQLLQQFLDEDTIIKDINGNYQALSPRAVYGLPNIKVFGGSRYLNDQRKVNDIVEALQLVSVNPETSKLVQYDVIVEMYFKYKGLPYDKIRKPRTPQELYAELLESMSAEDGFMLAAQALKQKQVLQKENERTQENQAKQQFINEQRTDEAFDQEVDKLQIERAEGAE